MSFSKGLSISRRAAGPFFRLMQKKEEILKESQRICK